jgi:tetraacyldisaccharide 4'-kinase
MTDRLRSCRTTTRVGRDLSLSQTTYLNIVSGQAPAFIGIPVRLTLRALSWPYSAVVRLRNRLYSSGLLRAHKAGVPVICVGNLTTGGTGKTPLVAWLCLHATERRCRCAILTRGYGTQKGESSDEPALLTAQCPGVPVIVNPDRVAGAAEAIRRHGVQVLVMDDGFQHRRLARDVDIVAIDATLPFGYGKMLPAGLLREPIAGLRRAHAAVLTRCDQVPEEALKRIEEDIRRINRDLVIARSIHAPVGIKTREGAAIGLDQLRGRQLFAFCGIGNPRSFFRVIEDLGGLLVGSRAYDDHYRYRAADLDQIRREAKAKEASLILTTQKDWTKISRLAGSQDSPPLAYLAVELQITAGAEGLTALIDRVLGGTMPTR